MAELWHKNFNPREFLNRIDIENFLDKNHIIDEYHVDSINEHCILCNQIGKGGILLNNKSFLCSDCFNKLKYIQYPEKYEILRRNYIKEKTARDQARKAFIDSRISNKIAMYLMLTGCMTFILLLINIYFLPLPIVLLFISSRLKEYYNNQINRWDESFPRPNEPILRHFHDPKAILTKNDKQVLYIFNHWPGYPPFWNYLREYIKHRDNYRCQVTGCPSRLDLHAHHKQAVSKGGSHEPDNLISLCDFHHALEPQTGHERIWGVIKTKYFILVREHVRSNRIGDGYHNVKTHLRRRRLITPSDFEELASLYGFQCPSCKAYKLRASLDLDKNKVTISCLNCNKKWRGPQQLAEETGPRLAEFLIITKNKGSWSANWEMLGKRKKNLWGEWKSKKVKDKRKRWEKREFEVKSAPKCPKCGAVMKLVKPKPSDNWSTFWGCTKYYTNNCNGSRKYNN